MLLFFEMPLLLCVAVVGCGDEMRLPSSVIPRISRVGIEDPHLISQTVCCACRIVEEIVLVGIET
jgi:hypothetical protein